MATGMMSGGRTTVFGTLQGTAGGSASQSEVEDKLNTLYGPPLQEQGQEQEPVSSSATQPNSSDTDQGGLVDTDPSLQRLRDLGLPFSYFAHPHV